MGVAANVSATAAMGWGLEQVFDQGLSDLQQPTPVPQPFAFDRAEMAIGQGHQHGGLQELLRLRCTYPETMDQGFVAGVVQIVKAKSGEVAGELLHKQLLLGGGEITVGHRQLMQCGKPEAPAGRRGVQAVDGYRLGHGRRGDGMAGMATSHAPILCWSRRPAFRVARRPVMKCSTTDGAAAWAGSGPGG